jgi:hypothetical protein
LEKKLVQRQVFLPNAQRLAFVMSLAYDAVIAAGGNDLDPAKQFPHFASQFCAAIRKLFADRVDDDITRRSTSDAELIRSRTRPVDPNAPQGGTAANAEDGSQILTDALWWQMDAVLNGLGGAIDGQEEYLKRAQGAFVGFDQDLRTHTILQYGFRFSAQGSSSFLAIDPDSRPDIFKLSQ